MCRLTMGTTERVSHANETEFGGRENGGHSDKIAVTFARTRAIILR